eukprot:scaffold17184_cov150-Skeletonema_marinoi.AAC.1
MRMRPFTIQRTNTQQRSARATRILLHLLNSSQLFLTPLLSSSANMFISICDVLQLLVLQDWETLRSTVLSDPTLFRNIASTISACSELNGMTLLHAAVRFNPPLEMVAQMIRLCPQMTAATDCLGRTALHVAAGSKAKASASLIKLIALACPAACEVQDEEGKTPLHFACDSSCVLFEDHNDDENDASNQPPNHESIRALLSYSIHAATLEDYEEMTPLEHAIMSDASLKTVKLLQTATSREKALPECDGSVLKNIWKVYGQTKSAKKLPPPISCRWLDKFGTHRE